MPELVNVDIRPHLITFLHQEFKGESRAFYNQKQVKLAKVKKSSVLGGLLTTFKERATQKQVTNINSYTIFFSIDEDNNTNNTAVFHEKTNTKQGYNYEVLQLLESDVLLINNYLESLYNVALTSFMNGYTKNRTEEENISKGVHEFMLHHNLYDTELDPESLRRAHYRMQNYNNLLSKIQNQVSATTKYYYLK